MADATHINYNLEHLCITGMLNQILPGMILERGYTEFRSHDVMSETSMAKLLEVFRDEDKETFEVHSAAPVTDSERRLWSSKVIDLGDMLLRLRFSSVYNWVVEGAGSNAERLDDIMARLAKALPPMKSEDPTVVPVNFWSQSPDGRASCRVRRINVPPWDTVVGNYTKTASTELDALMNLWPPIEDNGRLLLWHGEPGTGKSYGIRSLAQAWQKWCDIHYIVDPEKFFGDASYMLQVILQGVDGGEEPCADSCVPTTGERSDLKATEDRSVYDGPQWNLLIMEDSDEFLTTDAKMRTGQAMSRLLNLTSGFIGQGLNVLVLITTNVELEHVHGALQREGRCMANVEFGALTDEEAQVWASEHDLADDTKVKSATVADLYALTRRQSQLKTGKVKQAIGFAAR